MCLCVAAAGHCNTYRAPLALCVCMVQFVHLHNSIDTRRRRGTRSEQISKSRIECFAARPRVADCIPGSEGEALRLCDTETAPLCAGPYVRFAKEVLGGVSATLPPLTSVHLVSKTIGGMWKGLSPEQQQPYRDAFLAENAIYKQRAAEVAQTALQSKRQQLQGQQRGQGQSWSASKQAELTPEESLAFGEAGRTAAGDTAHGRCDSPGGGGGGESAAVVGGDGAAAAVSRHGKSPLGESSASTLQPCPHLMALMDAQTHT